MVTKFNTFKTTNTTKAWQTFHRIEGPGKTLLNLLELFPFSAKKFKLIKFNSNAELHYYLTTDYKRSFISYKNYIKKVKKELLLKIKQLRFRAINKYFKMLIFLINFLNDCFNNLIYDFFYLNYNKIEFNVDDFKNSFIPIKKKRKVSKTKDIFVYPKKNTKDNNNLNFDFYILMNNGLLEFIGNYNDAILLKLKQKIFLYYYNFFDMNLLLPKLSTRLRYLKAGDTFFFSHNITVVGSFIKFLDFFKLVHFNLGIGIKNKMFNKINAYFKKKINYFLFNCNKLLVAYYFFNEFNNFYFNVNENNSFLFLNENYICYYYYNGVFDTIKPNINFYFEIFYCFDENCETAILFDLLLPEYNFNTIKKTKKTYNKIYKNFEKVSSTIFNFFIEYSRFKHFNIETAEWHEKFESMVMYERFRFFNRLYMHDKLESLRHNLMVSYRMYFYQYLYTLLDDWDFLKHLAKKKKSEITRWLKKIQKFLSMGHNHILKDLIKNFVWKDHKVLNKVIKSHINWKGKKFINARQASGSYYYAINTFFIGNLTLLKLRLVTNDLIYENLEVLDELLLEFKLVNKNDRIRDKKKKKLSKTAKKFYDLMTKQKEEKGIFYCKHIRLSYNLNNPKSIKKYLLKLKQVNMPIKTYYRIYDKYINNLNNYNAKKLI